MNDLEALIQLGQRFGDLSENGIGMLFAGVTDALIQEGFERRVDPYGNAWPENRVAPNPFDRFSSIRSSFRVYYEGQQIVVSTTHVATWYQHFGTRRGIAPKPMVPYEGRGLGNWEARYQSAWENYMSSYLNGMANVPSNLYLSI